MPLLRVCVCVSVCVTCHFNTHCVCIVHSTGGAGDAGMSYQCKCLAPRAASRETLKAMLSHNATGSSAAPTLAVAPPASASASVPAPQVSDEQRVVQASHVELAVIRNEIKGLDKEVCTYATLGRQYTPQHYFHCADCGLMGTRGCCETCARNCHRGHNVKYAGMAKKFYCDCGDGSKCRSLQPVQVVPAHMLEMAASGNILPQHESNEDEIRLRQQLAAIKLIKKDGPSAKAEEEEECSDGENSDDDRFMCKVCLERPIDTVILECGHQTLCYTCAKSNKWSSCPICSAPVARIIRTYFM